MRLSEAIMLGDSLRGRNSSVWLTLDNNDSVCGCALGGAYLASGGDFKRYLAERRDFTVILRYEYPWLTEFFTAIIGSRFHEVCRNIMPLEKLADYVRSIEPDCDCNRFNCDCATQPAEVEAECLQAK